MLRHLLPLIPHTKCYVEPFCGSGIVLLNRPAAVAEVLNDIDGRIVNLFRVLQDERLAKRLMDRLYVTPYSRDEHRRAWSVLEDPSADMVDRAWALLVVQRQGMGGMGVCKPTVWGRDTGVGSVSVAHTFASIVDLLPAVTARLRRVQIENIDALKCIEDWDTEWTTFYVDPPYHPDTCHHHLYACCFTAQDHERLVQTLLRVRGAAVLSCYWHPCYQPLIDAGWQRTDVDYMASVVPIRREHHEVPERGRRLETILRNPKAVDLTTGSLGLFDTGCEDDDSE